MHCVELSTKFREMFLMYGESLAISIVLMSQQLALSDILSQGRLVNKDPYINFAYKSLLISGRLIVFKCLSEKMLVALFAKFR